MRWPDWWPPERHNAAVVNTATGLLFFIFGLTIGNATARGVFVLQEWQTLIAAAVAVIALVVTWTIGNRTLRFNLTKHEQELLVERTIPGLRQAAFLVRDMRSMLDPIQDKGNARIFIGRIFPELGPLNQLYDVLQQRMPLAEWDLIVRIGRFYMELKREADLLSVLKTDVDFSRESSAKPLDFNPKSKGPRSRDSHQENSERFEKASQDWIALLKSFEVFHHEIAADIFRAESRLRSTREWIDAFFEH